MGNEKVNLHCSPPVHLGARLQPSLRYWKVVGAIFLDDYISKGWLPGPAESQESKFWQEVLKRFASQADRGRICKFSKVLLLMPKIWPLCTGAKSNLRDEFRVKQKRIAFLLCQAKGDTVDSCPSKPCVPAWCDLVKSFIAVIQVRICW